jgi:uncharacterized protein involved in exopolysaccharide biosynthesis
MQQQLVTGLVQQYEDARIREVRDTPVITVIERPAIAVRADPRRGVLTVAAALSLSLLLAIGWVLVRDAIYRRRDEGDDPAVALLASEWKRLRRARQ